MHDRKLLLLGALALVQPTAALADDQRPGNPHGLSPRPAGIHAAFRSERAYDRGDHRAERAYDRREHRAERRHDRYEQRTVYGPPHGYAYPRGYAYRHYAVGGLLPGALFAPGFYFNDFGRYRLAPPARGFQWVRHGPDLLLVNVHTGRVRDVRYGLFH